MSATQYALATEKCPDEVKAQIRVSGGRDELKGIARWNLLHSQRKPAEPTLSSMPHSDDQSAPITSTLSIDT